MLRRKMLLVQLALVKEIVLVLWISIPKKKFLFQTPFYNYFYSHLLVLAFYSQLQ
ncbi:unnamed protein product [Meloidogyne enterolobii]|uniref:Uncharacterized protein n=1 Tax=Meloidogyne enterolobii TaxID=390850 RepID=A0ACB0ZVR8_MELEN